MYPEAALPPYTKGEPVAVIYRQINCYIYVYSLFLLSEIWERHKNGSF